MDKEFHRGILTEEIKEKARNFLGREIDTTELRLYPYLQYCLTNGETIDDRKINIKERTIIRKLAEENHLRYTLASVFITKNFFMFISEILWLGYVSNKLETETGIVLDLDDTALDDIEITEEQAAAMKKALKWFIETDLETGVTKLRPLNDEKTIILDKAENIQALITVLKSTLHQ